MSQEQIKGSQILPGAIQDLEVSPSAAIQESKLLFDPIAGHDHDTIGRPTAATLLTRQLRPTPSVTPDLRVQIAASPGINFPSGLTPAISAQSVSFSPVLPVTPNKRIDLIYLDSAGLLQLRQGAPTVGTPVPPSHQDVFPIAEVGPLLASTTAITSGMIKDVRPFLSANTLLEVKNSGVSQGFVQAFDIGTNLVVSVTSGIASLSAVASGTPVADASTTTKGIARISTNPISGDPIALSMSDALVPLISTAIQRDGSIVFTGSQSLGGNNLTSVGNINLSAGVTLTSGGSITSTGGGNINLTPSGKVIINSTTTALRLPNIAGTAASPNVGDIWYDSIADNYYGRLISGVQPLSMFAYPPVSTPTVFGLVKLLSPAASPANPIVVGANETFLPTQPQKNAMVGTNGTPDTGNPFVTNSDPRIPTASQALALPGTSGTPSGTNKYVTDADPRIPTQNENDALAGTAGAGPSSSNKVVLADYAVLPSAGEKSALVGTVGTPGIGNKYVTDSDTRLPTANQKLALAGTTGAGPSGSNLYVLQDYSVLPTANQKLALAGSFGSPDGVNVYVTTTDTRIPTLLQTQALVGTNGSPSSGNAFVTNSDPRLPTVGQKAALVGSSGFPGSSNVYVTTTDISYILRDGTRSFVAPISGIDPTLATHLATKAYVDLNSGSSNGAIGTPLQNISDLAAVSQAQRTDKQLRVVENGGSGAGQLYYFDLEAPGGGVAPNIGPGQWFPINAAIPNHNVLPGLQGGTVGQYFHLTSAQIVGLTTGSTTTLHTHSHANLGGLSADDHTQYSLVNGTRAYTGVVAGITPTLAAHLATKGYVDSVSISGSLVSGRVVFSTGASSISDDANFTWNNATKVVTLGGSAKTRMVHTTGTLANAEKAYVLTATTGTASSVPTVHEQITTQGSGGANLEGHRVELIAGYTGSGTTRALTGTNPVGGTGSGFNIGTFLGLTAGNIGTAGTCGDVLTSTGTNVGVMGSAGFGADAYGVVGQATQSVPGQASTGVFGLGYHGSPGVQIGGLFSIGSTLPSLVAAACLIDNTDATDPILIARANGVQKVAINSTGQLLTDFILPNTAADTVTTKSNNGLTIQAGDGTEGVKWRTLHVTTTNTATQTEATFDGGAVSGTTNTLQLANTTTHLYVVWLAARGVAGTNSGKMAAWRLEFVGDGDTGTAVVIDSVTQTVIALNGMTWDVTASFTSTRARILVTGDASTTIHWTAAVQETIVS